MNIGNLIRLERKAKGKTLREVAGALSMAPNSVWELEQNRGTMANLERVCQFLEVEWVALPPGSSLGGRVRTARVRRGWTQEGLAKKAAISRPALARVEADRAYISTLAVVLDVIAPDFRPRKPVIRQFAKSQDVKLTPPDFIEQVVHVLGAIELDPCPHQKSLVPATRHFSERDDGLSQVWNAKTVFVNPPYSIADKFMRKAHAEWLSGSAKCIIIILIPARTETKVFHELAADADIILLKNRMLFWSEQRTPLPNDAPFSSMVMIFGGNEEVIRRARETWAGVFVPKRTAT